MHVTELTTTITTINLIIINFIKSDPGPWLWNNESKRGGKNKTEVTPIYEKLTLAAICYEQTRRGNVCSQAVINYYTHTT